MSATETTRATMRYCARCVYPDVAVNSVLDDEGVCNACRASEEFDLRATPELWARRLEMFDALCEQIRTRPDRASNWDAVVPVSGGKDSYWQAHLLKERGLNPLLVTYHGNNFLPEGQANLDRMRDELGMDHLVLGPSVPTLRKLNVAGFRAVGDMNWHAHAGIKIAPARLAVSLRIPLMVWGEITWTVAGMFDPGDMPEYNARTVLEHDLRGRTWEDMVGREGLEAEELTWLRFPSDEAIDEVGLRGIYIGSYFPWKPNEHTELVRERYGFELAREPFQRTYRMMSNLDDMHENGIHDHMKFVKFGYGRASDHASKDVRDGLMTRDEAVEVVRRYDHVRPTKDLTRWLGYVGMEEAEYDRVADSFRDPRVWRIEDGAWWKDTLWGEPLCDGGVKLEDRSMWARYQA